MTVAKRPKLNENEVAYQQAVRDSFQQWARDERKYIDQLKDNLTAYRNQILADIPDEGTWASHRRQQTLDMLDDARATLDAQLSRTIVGAGNQAIGTAVLSVEAPLLAFGMNVANISRQLPLEQISFLQRTAPTLITNVSAQVHTDVSAMLQRYMSGGIRRQDLIRQIGSATGALPGATMKPGQIIPRAEMRAQTILRTEINAVSSIVQQHRVDELAAADKGVGSRWVHFPSRGPRPTHEALHGVTIFPGHGERFELSGVKITGPHDPALGAADRINCHCKVSTVYDPERSEKESDPIVVQAPAGSGAATATPAPPKPPVSPEVAKARAKNRAAAQKAVRAKAEENRAAAEKAKADAGDDGPVAVSNGDWNGEKAARKAADRHNKTLGKSPGTSSEPLPVLERPAGVAAPVKTAAASKTSTKIARSTPIEGERVVDMRNASKDDIEAYHAKLRSRLPLTDAEKRAINWYEVNSDGVTGRLRGTLDPSDIGLDATDPEWIEALDHTDNHISAMRSALAKKSAQLPEDVRLYRGVGHGVPGITDGSDVSRAVGTVISDKSFLSTSLDRSVASEFMGGRTAAMLEINAPSGTKAIFGSVDEWSGQAEVILSPGESMVVRSVRQEEIRGRMVTVVRVDIVK